MAKTQLMDKPPDGGWGCVVVASTFLIHVIVLGSMKSFGVFYAEFREVFQESGGVTAFISSVLGAAMFMFSPFAGALSNLTSCRTVIIAGGVISALGLIVSFFAQKMMHLFIGVGLTTGFGFSLMFTPSLAMIGRYFDRRHATANGIAICGTGVGIFVLPLLFQFLIDEFGWRGALLVVAGITLNGCVCGALLRPIHLIDDREDEQTDRKPQNDDDQNVPTDRICRTIMDTFDVTLLAHRPFLLYLVSLFVMSLGQYVVYLYVVAHAQSRGVEKTKAAFLLSIMGVTDAFSRPLNGWLSDRVGGKISKVYYYTIGVVGLAICNVALPFATSYTGLVVCMVSFGLFSGVLDPLIAVLVRKYSGVSRISGGLAWVYVFKGAASLFGAPIPGWLYDATGNYDMSFYAAGIFIFLSVIVLLLIPFSTRRNAVGSGSDDAPPEACKVVVVLPYQPREATKTDGQTNPGFED